MKNVEHPEVCIMIRNALLELGYDLNLYEVERFWRAYSKKQGNDWWVFSESFPLKQTIASNLNILNEIPFLPRE